MTGPEEVIKRLQGKAFQSFEVQGAFADGINSTVGEEPPNPTKDLVKSLVRSGILRI